MLKSLTQVLTPVPMMTWEVEEALRHDAELSVVRGFLETKAWTTAHTSNKFP